VEIKCQLDEIEIFIADLTACSTCFGHHYVHCQELKSIIQWLLPVVFRAVVFKLVWCGAEGCVRFARCWFTVLWFSSCWSGVELRVMCPVCRMLVYCAVVFKLLVWRGAESYVSGLQDAGLLCCGFQVAGLVWN